MSKEDQPGVAQQGDDQAPRIKVGEKEYSSEDVNNLLQTASSSSRSLEEAKPVLDMCQQYGITPDVLAQQANSAFSIVSDLISKGVIDEEGKLAKVASSASDEPKKKEDSSTSYSRSVSNKPKADAIAEEVLDPFKTKLQEIEEKLQALDRAQAGILREDIKKKLKGTFSNLEDDDIDQILVQATSQRGANLFEIAKTRSEGKISREDQFRKQLAEEWGVDLEKINEQKSLDPSKGAASLFSGKNFSFSKGKKDALSPKKAALEYLQRAT